MDTPWTTVASATPSSQIWKELAELPSEELKARVKAAVEASKKNVEAFEGVFSTRVHADTLLRILD